MRKFLVITFLFISNMTYGLLFYSWNREWWVTASVLKIPLIKVSNCQYMMPSIKDHETGKKCCQLHFIMYSKYVNNDSEARFTFWKKLQNFILLVSWFPAFSPFGPSQIRPPRRKLTHSKDCFSHNSEASKMLFRTSTVGEILR